MNGPLFVTFNGRGSIRTCFLYEVGGFGGNTTGPQFHAVNRGSRTGFWGLLMHVFLLQG